MDESFSIGGCGRRNGRQLFTCEDGFSMFIPLESVMLEREFDAEHKESETPDEEESSGKFDSQSDDDSSETGPGLGAQLDEKTTHQNNGISKQQVREEPETFLNKVLQESEKEQETALQLTQAAEEDYQEDFSITAVRFHDGEKEEERREENFCSGLSDTEQRLREELTRTEIRVVLLSNQLSRRHQDAENFHRQIQKMEQQLTVREDRKENFRTQLDKEQRLRAELNERETTEILLRKQLREKDCQEVSLQRTLCEQERQLEKERGLRKELIEKETTEILLRKQLREKDCQEASLQRTLCEQEWQLEKERGLRKELIEKETTEILLRKQLREKDCQEASLQRTLCEQERQLEKERRLREELIEKEATDILLRKQLREKDCQEASLQRKLSEQERQLEKERRLREELIEKEATEILPRKQLREMDCQEAHFRMQLRVQKQQLEEKVKGDETLGEQFQEMERRLREEITEKDARQVVLCEKITEKDQQLTEMIQQLTVTVEREEDLKTQQFIGATNDEEIPLFVTELMESNLRELLEQRPLSREEITVISLDVARALNYLHQKKPFPIFHRDVSSGNVLLWRQANQWRGKVSDYGSAKFEEQFMSIGPGCFAYSAPEVQIAAKQTAKIDVYSFGVLLCEMCIQKFPEYQNRERQIAQMTDQVLQDLVRRCVRSDPTERPDMTEIISTLEEFNKTL